MTTPQSPTMAAAMEKARVKRDVARLLAQLPIEAQRDVLADLTLVADGHAAPESVAIVPPHGKRGGTRVPRGGVTRGDRSGVTRRGGTTETFTLVKTRDGHALHRGPGRPRGSVAGGSMADKLYETLKTHPRMSIGDLAAKHYPGEDVEKGKHKVRAVLWSLKNQKRATNVEPGKWEVTA